MDQVQEWLLEDFPKDVLMPCTCKGFKAPRFGHAGAGWEWSDWDMYVGGMHHGRFMLSNDIGILLHDLCVVDVDSEEQARDLEARHPVLLETARERTRKGVHYFFSRSALCDADGYYDGAGQCIKGVDLKTRTESGNHGFLVVTPSTGKQWIVAPWQLPGELPVIPDELLREVARPKHEACRVELTFADDETMVLTDMRVLHGFRLFHDLISEWDQVPRLPYTKAAFAELYYACLNGVTPRFPSQRYVAELLTVAEYLDASPQIMRRVFGPTGSVARLRSVEACLGATVAEELHAEMVARVQGGEGVQLIHVELRDSPGTHKSLVPHACLFTPRPSVVPSELVIDPIRVVGELYLPEFAQRWLAGNEDMVIAGGGALIACTMIESKSSDLDFFLVGKHVDRARALEVARAMLAMPGVTLIKQSRHALTMQVDEGGCTYIAQLVLRKYISKAHLLLGFDLAPCKVLVDHALQVWALPLWRTALERRVFVVDTDLWGAASYLRVLKYTARGFFPFVPCLQRRDVEQVREVRQGVGMLFKYEARLARPRRWQLSEDAAIKEARRAFRLGHARSDYELSKRMTGALGHWLAWLNRRLFGRPEMQLDGDRLRLKQAAACSNFAPRSPAYTAAVAPDRYEEWRRGVSLTLTPFMDPERLLAVLRLMQPPRPQSPQPMQQ